MTTKGRSNIKRYTLGNITVPIYRRRRAKANGKFRTIYEVADYTEGERRLLGFTEWSEAWEKAQKIAEKLSSGEVEAASITNQEAIAYGKSVEMIRDAGLNCSLELGISVLVKIVGIVGSLDKAIEAAQFFELHRADKIKEKLVPEVIAELIQHREGQKKSARYVKDLKNRLNRFAKDFNVNISTITKSDVQHWLDRLDLAPQTVKNFRTVLGTLFQFAESRDYTFKGGAAVAETEEIKINGDGAITIFTPKEIAAVLKHAPKEFVPFVALGAFAGLRSAEIERLEYKDIDLDGGFIHLAGEKTKTRKRRLVPIQPNLKAWLANVNESDWKGYVWKKTTNDLQDARAATVQAVKADETAGLPEFEWKDNGLRHSYISYRYAAIQDEAKVAYEAGNKPAMVFQHYRELVRPADAQQWFSIVPEVAK